MKKRNEYMFPAIFGYEEGEEISVYFPDLDVATSGIDDKDAMKSAHELLGIVINGLEEDEENIPEPSKLEDIKIGSNERSVLVSVYMPAMRSASRNKSVNRTVTMPGWLDAIAVEKGANFSKLLQEATKAFLGLPNDLGKIANV